METASGLAHLLQQLQSIDRPSLPDDDTRVRILTVAQALCQRLETPFEWVQRMTWQEPTFNFCLKIADDLRLFEQLGTRASEPKTTAELTRSSHADPALIGRILRHLAGKSVIAEIAGDGNSYGATELSETLGSPEGSSGIRSLARVFAPVFQHVPEFLKSTEYKVPMDVRNGPFQQVMAKPGQTYFEWIQELQNKDAAVDFNLLMKFQTQSRKSWMDVFPPNDLLHKDRDADAPALVDIGGGTGADVLQFRRRYPDVASQIILQDLPAVINSAKAKNTDLTTLGIACQAYDFFTPERVHGACIYFLGSVLHDWPDQDARKILSNIVPAMTKGRSTLLLNENVIPATGCHPQVSAMDLTMMTLFGSQERTQEHWKELLDSEGLKLVEVHSIPSCLKSVLEVEKI